jgi:hypothetical protein
MGFRSLQHIKNSRSTFSRAKPTRYVPPSGFGCPLDVLLPRIPRRFYFTPAALLGFTLRRHFLPRGSRNLSVRKNPPTVSPAFIPTPKRQTGPTGLGFWVRASRGCLSITRRFRPMITGTSLGFCPCRVHERKSWPDFSDTPLACLVGPVDFSAGQPTPQSFNRSSLRIARPIPEYQPAEATLLGFLHLPAPDHSS